MVDDKRSERGWSRFGEQIQKDLKLWLLCVFSLEMFRAILITIFRRHMTEETGASDVLIALLNGLRYDARVGAVVVLPTMLLSFSCLAWNLTALANRLRTSLGVGFVALTIVVGRVDIGYFREYHNQFDHFVLGLLFDDMGAVMQTVGKQYSFVWLFVAGLLVIAPVGYLAWRWLRLPLLQARQFSHGTRSTARRILFVFIVLVVLFVAVRGSVGERPVQMRDAAISRDPFLNKVMFDPYTAFSYAWDSYRRLTSRHGLEEYLPDGDVAAAARVIAQVDQPLGDLDDALLHVARGPKGVPPRHIFVVLIESFDSWPMLERFSSLGLAGRTKAMGRNGIWVKSFLPASAGTMKSFAAVVAGLGDTGIMTNYQASARKPYPSSLPETFERLGYRSRMFYSGYDSWQRIGAFSKEQGFDEVHCGASIGDWMEGNEWGVNDEDLYRFILETVDDESPSFNLILTTTNHPPYDIDVYGRGFPLREIPPGLAEEFEDGNTELLMLGHHWYSDRAVGQFADGLMEKLPRSLIAITGDHWSRRFPAARPGLYDASSVPLVLYGPEVLEGVEVPGKLAGSHLDIAPTLVELIAPAGFRYFSVGRDILDPSTPALGFGRHRIIGPDFILGAKSGEGLESIPEEDPPADTPDTRSLLRYHRSIQGVSWFRINRGAEFP